MRIKTKLVALFAVPLLALGGIAALGFRSRTVADNAAATSHMIILVNQAQQEFNSALATERLSRLDAGIGQGALDSLAATTDGALDLVIERDGLTEAGETNLRSALQQARSTNDAWLAINFYNDASDAMQSETGLDLDQVTDADLFTKLLVSINMGNSLETRDRAWLEYFAEQETDSPRVVEIAGAFAEADRSQQDALRLALPEDLNRFNEALLSEAAQNLTATEAVAVQGLTSNEFRVSADSALDQVMARRVVVDSAHRAHDGALDVLIQDRHDQTIAERQLFGLLAAVGAIVLLGMLYTINRSISAPLDELVDRADHVANAQLPALIARLRTSRGLAEISDPPQIKTSSNDEIGDLVRAFNEMQTTAHTLATEQAISRRNVSDMFVNLGRRNQQLLQRMIGMVTELERTEENPETLESLFALDHMVTRMRRNAESLLVLAGSQAPRQWAKPVALEKATRGALTEVEKYQRIVINPMDPTLIQGAVVVDVTHLLAELLENALSFSDPSTAVTIDGQSTAEGYLMSITDHGIGMSEQELFENNQRLNNPPQLDLAPTRFLGLFVVGRLADRHGIEVQLVPGARQGTVARIQIPNDVLAFDDDAPAGDAGILDLASLPPVESALPVEDLPQLADTPPASLSPEPIALPEQRPEPVVSSEPVHQIPDPITPIPEVATPVPEPLRLQQPAQPPAAQPFPPISQPEPTSPLPTRGAIAQPTSDVARQAPQPQTAPPAQPQPQTRQAVPQAQVAPPVQHRPQQQAPAQVSPQPQHRPAAGPAEGERRRPVPGLQHPTPPASNAPLPSAGLPTRVPGSAVPPAGLTPTGPAPVDTNPQEAATGFSSMMSAFSSGVNRGLQDSDIEPEGSNQ